MINDGQLGLRPEEFVEQPKNVICDNELPKIINSVQKLCTRPDIDINDTENAEIWRHETRSQNHVFRSNLQRLKIGSERLCQPIQQSSIF